MRMVGGPLLVQGVRTIFTATVLLVAVFVWPLPVFAAPAVIINEVMWDEVEYVELHNASDLDINLEGWQLARQQFGGDVKTVVVFSEGDVIGAGDYFLIEKNEAATTILADRIVSALTLVNSGELVTLRTIDGDIADQAGQLGPWFFMAGNTDVGIAMERIGDASDGTVSTSWYLSTGEEGGRLGTPRSANSVPAVNSSPEALLSGPAAGLVGQTLTFSADDSTDPDEDELTFSWSFGYGSAAVGVEVDHVYLSPGSYTVTVTVSDGEAEVEATRTVAVTAPVYSTAVVINELLPNPVGSDTAAEFIELKNTGSEAVDLGGWQLDDAEGGSAPYTIPSGTTLGAGAIKVFMRSETKIALNNTADSVRLLDPTGAVKSSYMYLSSVPEGQSYNRTGSGTYVISTTPTAGSENVITAPVDEEEESEEEDEETTGTTNKAGAVAGATATVVSLKDIREEDEGTIVTTEGVVSVPPGLFGERIMYLAGSGIQVYFHQATFPEVKLGDTVAVTGELGSSLGEARLKVTNKESVKKIKSGEPPTPHILETGVIGEDYEGWLVTIQGEVVETSGDTFYVDDGSGEVKIYIKETTHIDKPKMKQGVAVTITGVVSETSSGYRILPRFQEDVRLGLVAGLTTFPATGVFSELISLPWCAIPSR